LFVAVVVVVVVEIVAAVLVVNMDIVTVGLQSPFLLSVVQPIFQKDTTNAQFQQMVEHGIHKLASF